MATGSKNNRDLWWWQHIIEEQTSKALLNLREPNIIKGKLEKVICQPTQLKTIYSSSNFQTQVCFQTQILEINGDSVPAFWKPIIWFFEMVISLKDTTWWYNDSLRLLPFWSGQWFIFTEMNI